jgi:hypothetical protein
MRKLGAAAVAVGYEEAAMLDPVGSYVVRVINFEGPPPSSAPQQETWTLFCEQPEGVIRSARQVFVARNERRTLDLRSDCKVRR